MKYILSGNNSKTPSNKMSISNKQNGGGSDYRHYWQSQSYYSSTDVDTLGRISEAPMFKPFGPSSKQGHFPNGTSGIIPIGAYLQCQPHDSPMIRSLDRGK